MIILFLHWFFFQERLKKLREANYAKNMNMAKAAVLNQTYDKDTSQLNSTYNVANQSQLNSTYSKPAETTYSSYDITPARHELPPEELVDQDNYNINDIKSDDDTDDEDNPRKQIPSWAKGNVQDSNGFNSKSCHFWPHVFDPFSGSAFRAGLMHQCYNMPDVDMIFTVMEATPDLSQIFEQKKRRFYKRTSSAQWGNAPVTHKYW